MEKCGRARVPDRIEYCRYYLNNREGFENGIRKNRADKVYNREEKITQILKSSNDSIKR